MINTIVECIDEDDIVLEHQEFIESNPYPNRQPPYKRYTSVDRNGGYFTRDRNRQNVSNSDKTNSKKIKNVTNITKNVDSQEEKKQSNFANIFGDSFPFKNGNPFGEGFSYNKNKTQDNLD